VRKPPSGCSCSTCPRKFACRTLPIMLTQSTYSDGFFLFVFQFLEQTIIGRHVQHAGLFQKSSRWADNWATCRANNLWPTYWEITQRTQMSAYLWARCTLEPFGQATYQHATLAPLPIRKHGRRQNSTEAVQWCPNIPWSAAQKDNKHKLCVTLTPECHGWPPACLSSLP
jgi:allantoicase